MKVIRMMLLAVAGTLIGVHSCVWAADGTGDQPVEAVQTQQPAPAEPGKWEAAGREVQDAAGAVAEATKETTGSAWDTLKSESAEVWQKT